MVSESFKSRGEREFVAAMQLIESCLDEIGAGILKLRCRLVYVLDAVLNQLRCSGRR
jgi:hypothetical protein